jgi:hypothetical protein
MLFPQSGRHPEAPSKGLICIAVWVFPFKTRPTFEKSKRREVQQPSGAEHRRKGRLILAWGEVLSERSELR